jgi:acetate kinase
MKILVINAGSSSLKYQLIDMDNEQVIAKGLAERIGIEGSNLQHRPSGHSPVRIEKPMKDHIEAMKFVLKALADKEHGVITDMSAISAVGHRVVHGGEKFSGSVLIDDEVMEAIRENVPLAPLHNPANIMGIEACRKVMPQTPMVAVFDTAFHQTMPPKAYLYGVPYDFYKRLKVRRYGFHGTSHKYVSERAAVLMGRPYGQVKIITCHLGNGCSIAAVDCGKSVDTSMGLTPLEGVLMGTRCGDIDPAIIEHLMSQGGLSIEEVMSILNKKSGLIGISGVSSDMRDTLDAAEAGNERAQAAVDVFCYRIRKYIGAYAAAMGGLDAVVFTAGIGENNPKLRKIILSGLEFLGICVDEAKNDVKMPEMDITAPGARVKAYVIATNEELVIARDTLALVK